MHLLSVFIKLITSFFGDALIVSAHQPSQEGISSFLILVLGRYNNHLGFDVGRGRWWVVTCPASLFLLFLFGC